MDQTATFAFAPDARSATALGGIPFDMRGVELGHHEGRCSFESFLLKYRLDDPALREIAAIVHEADLDDERFHTLEARGLDTVIRGLGMVVQDDHELLDVTATIYDGLYAWAGRTTA